MTKRRSLDDALSAEEEAFLSGGQTGAPLREPTVNAVAPHEPSTPARQEQLIPPAASEPAKPKQKALSRARPPVDTGLTSLNVRVEPTITTALLRASMQRRMERVEPSTQRDIVTEALGTWLKTNGYL